jgi:hypothetical protein
LYHSNYFCTLCQNTFSTVILIMHSGLEISNANHCLQAKESASKPWSLQPLHSHHLPPYHLYYCPLSSLSIAFCFRIQTVTHMVCLSGKFSPIPLFLINCYSFRSWQETLFQKSLSWLFNLKYKSSSYMLS